MLSLYTAANKQGKLGSKKQHSWSPLAQIDVSTLCTLTRPNYVRNSQPETK